MPLARYFLYVGGVLFALLLIADSYLPKMPLAEISGPQLPMIRIHSERKWPERVVYDTQAIIPASAGNIAPAGDGSRSAREAFAQLRPSDANEIRSADPKKPEPNRPQKKIAKRHLAPRVHLVARQPQFGWFGPRIW
jgi:hypothetical protein